MENENVNQNQTEQQSSADKGDTQTRDGNIVPSWRLKEEADRRRQAEERLSQLESKLKEFEQKKLEEEKKYEELYKQLKTEHDEVSSKWKRVEEFSQKKIEELLTDLNEDEKKELFEFVPENVNAFEKVHKIEKLKSKLFKKDTSGTSVNIDNARGGKGITEDDIKNWFNILNDVKATYEEKKKAYDNLKLLKKI